MPVDAENPRQISRKPPASTAPGPSGTDFVSPGSIPQAAPRGNRPLNAAQQARAAAVAALNPRQQANRARRMAAGSTPQGQPTNQPGGGLMQPPTGPSTQHPTNPAGGMGGPGSFIPSDTAPSSGMPPMSGGGAPGGGFQGGYFPPQQQGPGYGDPYSVTDPFQQFMSVVPVMNLNRDKQISDSMAEAGFGGNRYGSFAAGKAAEIGGQTALQQDALLWKMLSDYGNNTQDRQLQAQGQALTAAGLQDQMAMNRLQLPFQIGQYEQNRQDQFSNTAYQDFNQNRLGWLGPLLQAAMSQGAGSPGQIYQTSTPSSPGVADYLPLLMQLFGGGGG